MSQNVELESSEDSDGAACYKSYSSKDEYLVSSPP
jgi:hypothetical protein